MGDDYLEGFQGTQEVVVVAHQAQAVEEWTDDVALFGELDYVLWFQWEHDHELCDNVGELWDARVEELQEVLQNVDVHESARWRAGNLVLNRVLATNGIELLEQWRRWLSIGVEQNILKQRPHQMQVIQTEPRRMRLFRKEQNNLSEEVSYETIIWVPGQAPERETNQFL